MKDIRILLHDIRSVYNVGAIFRTADAIGVSRIYLSGYTPGPLDRFNRVRKDFAKSALGSEKSVASEHIDHLEVLKQLKKEGFQILVIEQEKDSIDYKKVFLKQKILIIFGNEVLGVEKDVLKIADVVAEIPMKGKKESLNVSVSAGIVLYRWFD
ncbi:MAG: RNA methyltransferase [Candidatus Taylorbacteria bacterium CG10_big_fil_rev_8_21_14_0_10_41_48]|uniref:RNA methyltransferase n=1 Tax=Candidatus Taylorbacteria bacterium CG10_big_fil_rev_8_21_14_0_10_41_48 TaxID=1975024 RepID=A0A2M8LD48_9BACT|nr:MAG: RNA methyltransferase [Candidatus Taylorbacteria bacterium CG10_big_fil_rev_8_21_14_0_10_41_48]